MHAHNILTVLSLRKNVQRYLDWKFWTFKITCKFPIRTMESSRKSATINFNFFPVLVKTQLKREVIKCNIISL